MSLIMELASRSREILLYGSLIPVGIKIGLYAVERLKAEAR